MSKINIETAEYSRSVTLRKYADTSEIKVPIATSHTNEIIAHLGFEDKTSDASTSAKLGFSEIVPEWDSDQILAEGGGTIRHVIENADWGSQKYQHADIATRRRAINSRYNAQIVKTNTDGHISIECTLHIM